MKEKEMKEAMLIFCVSVENHVVLVPGWVKKNYLNFCRILGRKPKKDI